MLALSVQNHSEEVGAGGGGRNQQRTCMCICIAHGHRLEGSEGLGGGR